MLVLTIHITLLDKGEGGLESTPRADILEAVQDLFILTVLLGEERDRAWKRQGEDGGSTKPFTLPYSPGSFFLGVFPLPIPSLISFCPTLDSEFPLSELSIILMVCWVVSESSQRS